MPDAALDAGARKLLETSSDELASAVRRLGTAGMLSPVHTRDLERAHEALTAALTGGMAPSTAIARYAFALQEVAAGLHIPLGTPAPGGGEGNGLAAEGAPAPTATVVEALAYAGSLAAGAGHRLSGFTGAGNGTARRFTARCDGCGGTVSVQREAGGWSFSRVLPCTAHVPAPATS